VCSSDLFQATHSNAARVHGGKLPLFKSYFAANRPNIVYDKLQSEQGTRFFGKRNRNVLTIMEKVNPENSKLHKWFDTDVFLDLLKNDYLVNTDARSVLVCSPWEILVNRKPFARYKDGFGKELFRSLNSDNEEINIDDIKNEITESREATKQCRIIPLETVDGWSLKETGISPHKNELFSIRYIKVRAHGREVSEWDQPILDSYTKGKVVLPCGRKNKILYFLFKKITEPGLHNKVELTPAVFLEPGKNPSSDIDRFKGIVRADCNQSEEGGKIFQRLEQFPNNRYRQYSQSIKGLLLVNIKANQRTFRRRGLAYK